MRVQAIRNGLVAVTLMTPFACMEADPIDNGGGDGHGCEYNGETYDVGDSFEAADGCNTCFCEAGGAVGCTEMACDPDPALCDGTDRDDVILVASKSFGMCAGECISNLDIEAGNGDGACDTAILTVSGWDAVITRENIGTLTPAGHALARSLAAALVGETLDETYGCPDCADGGASSVTLAREGELSMHQYEYSNPPDALVAVDEFTMALITALDTCTDSDNIVMSSECTPRD